MAPKSHVSTAAEWSGHGREQRGRHSSARPAIAYLAPTPEAELGSGVWDAHRILAGAERRAAELGRRIEVVEGENTVTDLQELVDRGFGSAILHPSRVSGSWRGGSDSLNTVMIGYRPPTLVMPTVTIDINGTLRVAMRQAIAAGFRRPGLVIPASWETDSNDEWSVAFLVEQTRLALSPPIPVFRTNETRTGSGRRETGWLEDFAPDVIFGSWCHVGNLLARHNLRVPGDLAFVDLSRDSRNACAGVDQNFGVLGATAVDRLILPERPGDSTPPHVTTVYVPGTWFDGPSLPRRGEK